MREVPVLIVGAGPVGLTAAATLRQQGVAFRLIDRNLQRVEQSRAAVVHARTVEVLDHLGLAEEAVAASAIIREASICSPPGREFMRGSFATLESRFPFALGLSQPETERILEDSLGEHGVERGTELVSFHETEDGVEAVLRLADGSEETMRAQYLVGANGSRSNVRHDLGLTLEGNSLDVMWLTADVKITWDRSREMVYQFFADGGFSFVAPLGKERWRVIVAVNGWSQEKRPETTLEAVQAACDKLELGMKLYDPVWISTFGINTRMSPRFRVGRIFLAGDAAHVHSPAGGQGMNTGMQDAFNLGWKLGMVLRGEAGEPLLESYHDERHANAKRLLGVLGPLSDAVSRHNGMLRSILPHTVGLLSHVLPIKQTIAGLLSELSVSYPESPIVGERGSFLGSKGPKPGERAAEVLEIDGGSLFARWRGDPRHQLLFFAGEGDAAALAERAREFSGWSWLHAGIVARKDGGDIRDAEGRIHRAYGMEKGGLYLIRPDQYVAFRGRPADAGALREFLCSRYSCKEA